MKLFDIILLLFISFELIFCIEKFKIIKQKNNLEKIDNKLEHIILGIIKVQYKNIPLKFFDKFFQELAKKIEVKTTSSTSRLAALACKDGMDQPHNLYQDLLDFIIIILSAFFLSLIYKFEIIIKIFNYLNNINKKSAKNIKN